MVDGEEHRKASKTSIMDEPALRIEDENSAEYSLVANECNSNK